MMDAATSNGLSFRLITRRKAFGIFAAPPPLVGESMNSKHLGARRTWRVGAAGVQISWSHHGRVHILRMADGTELAAWSDEVRPA